MSGSNLAVAQQEDVVKAQGKAIAADLQSECCLSGLVLVDDVLSVLGLPVSRARTKLRRAWSPSGCACLACLQGSARLCQSYPVLDLRTGLQQFPSVSSSLSPSLTGCANSREAGLVLQPAAVQMGVDVAVQDLAQGADVQGSTWSSRHDGDRQVEP